METSFGITEYACGQKLTSIPCLLKEMYSDFIVQEILEDQRVLPIPSPDDIIECTEAKEKIEIHENVDKPSFLTEEKINELDSRFLERGPPVVISIENLEKDQRKQIHEFIRNRYCGKLISEMKPEGIVVSHGHTNSSRKRKIWDDKIPKECHFTLCKENKDTNYAIGIVAKFLNAHPNSLRTHGIKDKRGVTSQRVSCHQILERTILDLNRKLRQIKVFDCEYRNEPVQMGAHWGNRFSIILRNLPPNSKDMLNERLENLHKKGFINYFGTQRFGSRESNTASIGLSILKRNWEEAVKQILKNSLPNHLHDSSVGNAIECFEKTSNAKLAFSKLKGAQSFATIEGMVLKCLSKDGTWQKCITEAIPVQTRSLYVHAYQSLIWNRIVSRRVRENGTNIVEGDVDVNGKSIDSNGSHFDIHFPLPGENETFSGTYAMKWIEEELKKDELTLESFTKLQDRFSLGDSSRALFAEPKNLEWKFINYNEPKAYLQDGLYTRAIKEEEQTGPLLALQVKFSLKSGCYATVALREITGTDMGKKSMKEASFNAKEEKEIEE